MKYFTKKDFVTLLAILILFTGQSIAIAVALGWLSFLGYEFIRDYEKYQSELRKLAQDD